jgi:rod shape determining protein RodA
VLFCAGSDRVFLMLGAIAAAQCRSWGHLKTYQQQRVLTFLSPEMDPLGAGYHVIQSKIAIGSGNVLGEGLPPRDAEQAELHPEQHTDFIFSVFRGGVGYVGALVLIGLYAALVVRGLMVAYRAKDRFGALLVVRRRRRSCSGRW